jgi:lipopolysaccharide export system permease protein
MDQRDDVARVSPGVFNESKAADRVFFVGEHGEDGKVKNVFISSIQQGRLGVMATAQGHTETMPNGDRFLVLDRGRRYEGTAGTAEYRVMEFDRYAVRIETKEARGFD